MGEYTEAELLGLSEEERAALVDEITPEEQAALNAIVNEKDAGDESGNNENGESGDEGGNKDADSDDAGIKAELKSGDNDERKEFVPKYSAEPVEDYAGKMAELDRKFEENELTLKEYNTQRDDLNRAQFKSEVSAEQNAQVDAQLWNHTIADFMDEHPEYNESKMRHAALDATVKELASNPDNSDKSGRWFLREAHKLVQAEFGATSKVDAKLSEKDAKPETKEKLRTEARKPDMKDVPKTLAGVPAAESGDVTGEGEFSNLDKLNGIELERAVARLSDEQRARYLAS